MYVCIRRSFNNPYIYIYIYIYILTYLIKENGFTLKKGKKQTIP